MTFTGCSLLFICYKNIFKSKFYDQFNQLCFPKSKNITRIKRQIMVTLYKNLMLEMYRHRLTLKKDQLDETFYIPAGTFPRNLNNISLDKGLHFEKRHSHALVYSVAPHHSRMDREVELLVHKHQKTF